jgi:succinate dehydrogenase / fumarate reductase membrane anchor subunit
MLWLAQLHGANGLRTVIADYSRKDTTRFWLNTLLAVSVILIMALGTYTIFTFSPDIPAH